MMAAMLRILDNTDIVHGDARIDAYVERCTARTAFRRALAAQLDDFELAA